VAIVTEACQTQIGTILLLVDSPNSGLGPETGSCEHNNETLVSIKRATFLDQLSHYQIFKACAQWN